MRYGLDEIEVLEYILRRGGATSTSGGGRLRRYILQGFFNAEMALFGLLQDYYQDSFATKLIGFPRDYRDYSHQVEILASWSKKLTFGGMTLVDEVEALEEEIRG